MKKRNKKQKEIRPIVVDDYIYNDPEEGDMLVAFSRNLQRARADQRFLRVVRRKYGEAVRAVLRQSATWNTCALIREHPRQIGRAHV